MSHFNVHFHANLLGICSRDVFWAKPWEEIDGDYDDGETCGCGNQARVVVAVQADDATTAMAIASKQMPPTGWENSASVELSIHMVRADIIYPVPTSPQAAEALLRYEPASNALSIALAQYFGANEVEWAQWSVPWLPSETPCLHGVHGLTSDVAHAFLLLEHREPGQFIELGHRALELMAADGVASPTQFARYLLLALIVSEMGVSEQAT